MAPKASGPPLLTIPQANPPPINSEAAEIIVDLKTILFLLLISIFSTLKLNQQLLSIT